MNHAIVPVLAIALSAFGRASAAADWDGGLDCEGHKSDGDRACYALSIGRSVEFGNQYVASLVYECRQRGGEWLYFAYRSDQSVNMDTDSIAVTWKGRGRKRVKDTLFVRTKRTGDLYVYVFVNPTKFLDRMLEHTDLYAKIPYQRWQKPMSVKFGVEGGAQAISEAMGDCQMVKSAMRKFLSDESSRW